MPPAPTCQFGPFRLDTAGRVLFRDGQRIALTPKAVDVLIALVEARGQPVGKEELMQKVWAGTIVEESSLTSHIFLLRKALGESKGGGYIETLSKRGYRFVGQITEVSPPDGAPAPNRVVLAVLPFESRSGTEGCDDFGDALTEELITQLVRIGSPRLRVTALVNDPAVSHRLEGSVRRAGAQSRTTARLTRVGDGSHVWAESYERGLHDVLTLQADLARAIAGEVKTRLVPLRRLTFLFTAIEGSTVPWDALAAMMERHNALLRDAGAEQGRQRLCVVDEGFFVAFPDATSALRAAVELQRALDVESIKICIGLHSGTVEDAEDEDFSGPTVARAAGVMAAAHAGQILLTASTVALLERMVPPGCELRDLGDHTLRGFARPERLYQLTVVGTRSEFPPIRTQEAMRTNLPPSLTMFIGRQQALAQVREQLRKSRMVTLVGAGGTGKTRLSLEVARQLVDTFPDGVWLVELAPLADATLVPRAIAAALGARAEGDMPAMTLVQSTLRYRRVLLVLDNCEHVVEEAAQAAQALLRTLPQIQLLATSRQALGIEGEAIYRVPSLTMPGAPESTAPQDVIASEAGQLFVDRATAVQPAFALSDSNATAVAQLCRRLDGIPLAIELAAARLTALSVDEIARRIDDRFSLLTGGLRSALPRQRTLRALVDWSYDLLSADERIVLDTLAVFAGSFSLEAAERVCADAAPLRISTLDAIEQLVVKSLLIAEAQEGAGTRYRLLETIRQYAGEKLVAGGRADGARKRHFAYFHDLAESGANELAGPLALEWLDRLEAEHDDLRAALDWSVETDPLDYARLAAALRHFWDIRGHFAEGWARLTRALDAHSARDPVRLEVLIGTGLCAHRLAYARRSDDTLSEAIALAQDLGNVRREAEAVLWLSWVRRHSHGADAAEKLAQRGSTLARAAGDRRLEAFALIELGKCARGRGQYSEATQLFLDSARLFSDAGCVIDTPNATDEAGQSALEQLDFASARGLLADALVQHRRVGNVHDGANTQVLLGLVALNEHRLHEARALSAESLRIFQALHDPKCEAKTAIAHATVLCALGEPIEALTHAEAAATTYRTLGIPLQLARALCAVGCIHAALGHADAARHALFNGLIEQQRADLDTSLPMLLEAIAGLHPDAPVAARLLGAADAHREQLNLSPLPHERAERAHWVAEVRAQYPDSEFDHAFAAGRILTRDNAIECALALRQSR